MSAQSGALFPEAGKAPPPLEEQKKRGASVYRSNIDVDGSLGEQVRRQISSLMEKGDGAERRLSQKASKITPPGTRQDMKWM